MKEEKLKKKILVMSIAGLMLIVMSMPLMRAITTEGMNETDMSVDLNEINLHPINDEIPIPPEPDTGYVESVQEMPESEHVFPDSDPIEIPESDPEILDYDPELPVPVPNEEYAIETYQTYQDVDDPELTAPEGGQEIPGPPPDPEIPDDEEDYLIDPDFPNADKDPNADEEGSPSYPDEGDSSIDPDFPDADPIFPDTDDEDTSRYPENPYVEPMFPNTDDDPRSINIGTQDPSFRIPDPDRLVSTEL